MNLTPTLLVFTLLISFLQGKCSPALHLGQLNGVSDHASSSPQLPLVLRSSDQAIAPPLFLVWLRLSIPSSSVRGFLLVPLASLPSIHHSFMCHAPGDSNVINVQFGGKVAIGGNATYLLSLPCLHNWLTSFSDTASPSTSWEPSLIAPAVMPATSTSS